MYISLVSVMVAAALSVGKGQREKNCDVFPQDQYIEVGSGIELVCERSCFNHGKIFWTLNRKNISESLSKTINSTHTVLSLRNVTQSSATVECHSSYTNQVLGGTIIRTYSKPENVTCFLHYEDGLQGVPNLFTCTWKHHKIPSQTVDYTVLHGDSLNEICKSQVTNCTAEHNGTASKIFTELFGTKIVVRAKTAAWEVNSDPFMFNSFYILKLYRPMLTAITPSPDHLSVEWKLGCPDKNCHCEVKYYKISVSNDTAPKYLITPQSQLSARVKEMESCVNYNISVRCVYYKGIWSDWSQEKTVLTKLNKSQFRLRLWRKVAEQGKNGERKVRLMWKGIPSTCKELNYMVKHVPYEGNTTAGNYTYTSCDSSSCDVVVDQHAHRLYLAVSVDDVLLAEESVYVPAIGETGLPEILSIETTTHEGIIQVSWKGPEQTFSGYMIDWTHDGKQYNWKESEFPDATLPELLPRKPYNITVTPLLGDSTGHSIHANQICSSIGVAENISITVEDLHDKSAFVRWDTKSRHTCSAVLTYVIFYEAQGLQHNVTVDGREDGVRLKDLKPHTQYIVRVKANGYGGSRMSNTLHFTTNTFDSKLIIVFSVCGGLLIFLILSLGLTCVIQWKKFSEKHVPNPRFSSVATWLSQSHVQTERIFQDFRDFTANQVVTSETQREGGSPLNPVCNGYKTHNQTLTICDPSFSPTSEEHEPYKRFSETSGTHLLSSPEGSIVFSSPQSSPYRSQDTAERLLPRGENPSKNDSGKKQKSLYVSLNMFDQSGDS